MVSCGLDNHVGSLFMKFAKFLSTLAIGAGVLVAAQNASAVTASTTISNFGYRLVDLDTTDGIAPTITFGWTFSETYLDTCRCGGGEGEAVNFSFDFPSAIASRSDMYNVQGVSSISSNEYAAQLGSIHVSNAVARSDTTSNFTLSANTKLIVFGISNGSMTNYQGEAGTMGISNYVGISEAGVLKTSHSNSYYGIPAPAGSLYSESFEIEYSNLSAADAQGTLDIGSGAGLTISAVPEPSTYAMLMAGLLVAGVAARRRRS